MTSHNLLASLPALCLLAACADVSSGGGEDGLEALDEPADEVAPDIDDGAGDGDAGESPDDLPWTPPSDSRVYVNTETTLFYIDPAVSPDLQQVGDFSGPCTAGSGFYDIALDGERNMAGIAAEGLYAVDRDTAACTVLRSFPSGSPHFFSLSYVKGFDSSRPDDEALFAASVEEGEWVRIDPAGTTLDTIFIHGGWYDVPDHVYVSSGDIVSLETGPESYRTFATLKCSSGYTDPGCESDWLAEIDPGTGIARMIGPCGFRQVFGLGFWGSNVYGFTNAGQYILIDVDTGVGTLVRQLADDRFWGAGTTTRPYVVI